MTRRVQAVLCISCPTGCNGEVVVEDGTVAEMRGYTCKKGKAYVAEEVIAPKRTVTTTVRVNNGALVLLPVVSDRPVPKDAIFSCLSQLRRVTVTAPVAADSVVLPDILGLGINFLAARDCASLGSPDWIEAGAPQSEAEKTGPEIFQKQLQLLRKRLLKNPQSLRQIFIEDGTVAIAWEFRQDELGGEFTKTLWNLLLRDDDMSVLLQRFIGAVPLALKHKFIAALDAHLGEHYPMFNGLSQDWPSEGFVFRNVRSTDAVRCSLREVELFIWLETLRRKRCDDRPNEKCCPDAGALSLHAPEPGFVTSLQQTMR